MSTYRSLLPRHQELAQLDPVTRAAMLDTCAQHCHDAWRQQPPRGQTPLVRARYNAGRRLRLVLTLAHHFGHKPRIRVAASLRSATGVLLAMPRPANTPSAPSQSRFAELKAQRLKRQHLLTSSQSRRLLRASLETLERHGDAEEEIICAILELSCLAMAQGAQSIQRPLNFRKPPLLKSGQVRRAHALDHFGRWLLLEGAPGLAPVPGRRVDPMVILQMVSVLVGEHLARETLLTPAPDDPRLRKLQKHRKPYMTRGMLRDRWAKMFGEILAEDHFKSRIASTERYLRAYLDQPAPDGRGARLRSPRLEAALSLLPPRKAAQPATPPVASPEIR